MIVYVKQIEAVRVSYIVFILAQCHAGACAQIKHKINCCHHRHNRTGAIHILHPHSIKITA